MIILASSSPRRMELLQQVGITPVQRPPVVDETPHEGESPEELVLRLARDKAMDLTLHPGEKGVILAADTIVLAPTVIGDAEVLGKPTSPEDNVSMLERLSGVAHSVLTGVCVRNGEKLRTRSVRTDVYFRALSRDEIIAYAQSGEGSDKAGGYAVQGMAAAFVERIDGSYTNVVGLPICEVIEELRNVSVFAWP